MGLTCLGDGVAEAEADYMRLANLAISEWAEVEIDGEATAINDVIITMPNSLPTTCGS